MLHNAKVFLRKAADEIVGHSDHADAPFTNDRATVIMVLIQTAIELAAVALVIRHRGVRAILAKDPGYSDEEIRQRWLDGDLRTHTFAQIEILASQIYRSEEFWGLAETFAGQRNKLVHLHLSMEGDAYDLKYDAIYMLIATISHLIAEDSIAYVGMSGVVLGQKRLRKLTSFGPYQYRIRQVASEHGDPLKCVICDCEAYVADEEHCFGCGSYYPSEDLLKCPFCSQRTVMYDELNISQNEIMKALCTACDEGVLVARCRTCENDYIYEPGDGACPFCDDDGSNLGRLPIPSRGASA
ncbi:MAG: hypothetical protein EON90_00485 [Brevundimonas sp.]|nr:MAG: hypothetical protein EON90_00485 [Brevundimonas sp.]